MYPFIDYAAGGSIDGMIKATDANLAVSAPTTLIIPGHGAVGPREDVLAFRDMLVAIRGRSLTSKARDARSNRLSPPLTAAFDAR